MPHLNTINPRLPGYLQAHKILPFSDLWRGTEIWRTRTRSPLIATRLTRIRIIPRETQGVVTSRQSRAGFGSRPVAGNPERAARSAEVGTQSQSRLCPGPAGWEHNGALARIPGNAARQARSAVRERAGTRPALPAHPLIL